MSTKVYGIPLRMFVKDSTVEVEFRFESDDGCSDAYYVVCSDKINPKSMSKYSDYNGAQSCYDQQFWLGCDNYCFPRVEILNHLLHTALHDNWYDITNDKDKHHLFKCLSIDWIPQLNQLYMAKFPLITSETQYCLDKLLGMWEELSEWKLRGINNGYRVSTIKKWLSRNQIAGYIYLIKGLYETPTYKIGYTKTKKTRIRKLDVVLPFPIEVTHLITTDHMKAVEAYLHDRFADKRINGEWFELSEQDVADICAIETLNAEDIA